MADGRGHAQRVVEQAGRPTSTTGPSTPSLRASSARRHELHQRHPRTGRDRRARARHRRGVRLPVDPAVARAAGTGKGRSASALTPAIAPTDSFTATSPRRPTGAETFVVAAIGEDRSRRGSASISRMSATDRLTPRRAHAPFDRRPADRLTMRVGVIGLGWVAPHARSLLDLEDHHRVACTQPGERRAAHRRLRHPDQRQHRADLHRPYGGCGDDPHPANTHLDLVERRGGGQARPPQSRWNHHGALSGGRGGAQANVALGIVFRTASPGAVALRDHLRGRLDIVSASARISSLATADHYDAQPWHQGTRRRRRAADAGHPSSTSSSPSPACRRGCGLRHDHPIHRMETEDLAPPRSASPGAIARSS